MSHVVMEFHSNLECGFDTARVTWLIASTRHAQPGCAAHGNESSHTYA